MRTERKNSFSRQGKTKTQDRYSQQKPQDPTQQGIFILSLKVTQTLGVS